jgi:hypothetical protein
MGPFDYQPYAPSWRRVRRPFGVDPVVWHEVSTTLWLACKLGMSLLVFLLVIWVVK